MSTALGFAALHVVAKPVRAARRHMTRVLEDVRAERYRQIAKWGDDSTKDHADGTGRESDAALAEHFKAMTDAADAAGVLTWRDILAEEVAEAFAETDNATLRAELVQVAAVAVKWVEAIDRRGER